VQLVGLVKRFESFTAVDGIDLDIPSGEFFSLLGPSGCGKTTTLRMIAGFEHPTSGEVRLNGVDMAGTAPKVAWIWSSCSLTVPVAVSRSTSGTLDMGSPSWWSAAGGLRRR
jgi:ABC-type nitrate/sulfonate/bicarbonate transport system ATPase subunit